MKKVGSVLLLFIMFCVFSIPVLASGNNNTSITVKKILFNATLVHDMQEINNKYHGRDGVYYQIDDDGNILISEISTESFDNKDALLLGQLKAARVSEQKKTYNYVYCAPDGTEWWKSTIEATFDFNGSKVWCVSGNAKITGGSKVKYSKNSYSSKKVTGISYYTIEATFRSHKQNFHITQQLGSDPNGNYTTVIDLH